MRERRFPHFKEGKQKLWKGGFIPSPSLEPLPVRATPSSSSPENTIGGDGFGFR